MLILFIILLTISIILCIVFQNHKSEKDYNDFNVIEHKNVTLTDDKQNKSKNPLEETKRLIQESISELNSHSKTISEVEKDVKRYLDLICCTKIEELNSIRDSYKSTLDELDIALSNLNISLKELKEKKEEARVNFKQGIFSQENAIEIIYNVDINIQKINNLLDNIRHRKAIVLDNLRSINGKISLFVYTFNIKKIELTNKIIEMKISNMSANENFLDIDIDNLVGEVDIEVKKIEDENLVDNAFFPSMTSPEKISDYTDSRYDDIKQYLSII